MNSCNGANILVVGGAGFVGSNLVRLLLAQAPARIVVIDNLLSADASNVPDDPRIEFISRSIRVNLNSDAFPFDGH